MRKLKWLFMVCAITVLVGIGSADVRGSAAVTEDGFRYYENGDGTITITEYTGTENTVTVPSEINGKSVETIGSSAFSSCDTLETVVLPDTLKTIKAHAFGGCTKMKTIVLPKHLTTIGAEAFRACYALETIDIPAGITKIEDNTFECCSNLKFVTLPDSLVSIGSFAFERCALRTIVLPKNLTTIGEGAFTFCMALQTIDIPDGVTCIEPYTFASCINMKQITLSNQLKSIDEDAFDDCTSLNTITIPDSVTYISDTAFYNNISIRCNPGSYARTFADEHKLKFFCITHSDTVIEEIPATCQHIGGTKSHCLACGEDTWLHEIPIQKHKIVQIYTPPTCLGNGYTEIYCEFCKKPDIDENGDALKDPNNPTPPLGHKYVTETIHVKARKKTVICARCGDQRILVLSDSDYIVSSGNKYTVTKTKTLAFAGTESAKPNIVIPDTVTYNGSAYKVTAVADHALKGNKKVTKVTIGNHVSSIGKRAFSGCTKLQAVTIGKNVKTIGIEAFKGCGKLKTLTVNSKKLDKIGKNALKGIHPKASIKVPAQKLKKYQKAFKKKGQKATVRITK